MNFGPEFWFVLSEMAPYLLFGFLMAGLLSVLISARTVERHLGGRKFMSVFKAAIFGVPLPLCSCGVIPVAASLRRSGAGRGATTSFLLSTPQTGVDSILVTYSLLGPVFAVFRPLAALVTGLVGGSVVSAIEPDDGPAPADHDVGDIEAGHSHGVGPEQKGGRLYRSLHYGFVALPRDIGRALLVGLVIAGLISALIPEDYFSRYLGPGILQMLVMMAVGLPIYVCATASVPIAAALIAAGISPGAALVFLMTGPATNAATIATIWRIMGRRTTIIYLATVAVSALVSGLVLDHLFEISGTTAHIHSHEMIPSLVKHLSAVVLLGLLAYALISPKLVKAASKEQEPSEGDGGVTIDITGMHCTHCSESVERALSSQPGVERAEVDLDGGRALVRGAELDVEALCKAVEELGYKADARTCGAKA